MTCQMQTLVVAIVQSACQIIRPPGSPMPRIFKTNAKLILNHISLEHWFPILRLGQLKYFTYFSNLCFFLVRYCIVSPLQAFKNYTLCGFCLGSSYLFSGSVD